MTTGSDDHREPNAPSFAELAGGEQPTLFREFIVYLGKNKKWWLVPFLLVLALFGCILALSLSGGLASIYTLF